MSWKNRIVGHGEEPPDQLLANPHNWRTHPQHQLDALAEVIDDVGYVDSVIVNKTTGHLVDGHARVMLALRRNEKTVPVDYVELSESEEKKILLSFDPITGMATADKEKLEELLKGFDKKESVVFQAVAKQHSILLDQLRGNNKDSQKTQASYCVLIECNDEQSQLQLLEECQKRGLTCRALLS